MLQRRYRLNGSTVMPAQRPGKNGPIWQPQCLLQPMTASQSQNNSDCMSGQLVCTCHITIYKCRYLLYCHCHRSNSSQCKKQCQIEAVPPAQAAPTRNDCNTDGPYGNVIKVRLMLSNLANRIALGNSNLGLAYDIPQLSVESRAVGCPTSAAKISASFQAAIQLLSPHCM